MKKNIIVCKNNNLEYLIGVLLLIPLFIFIVPFQNDYSYNFIIFPLTVYLPMLMGLFLCKKFYYKKSDKYLGMMFILTMFSFVCFFSLNISGQGGFGTMFMWGIFAFINKLLGLQIFYSIAGKEKFINFVLILILLILLFYLSGFDLG